MDFMDPQVYSLLSAWYAFYEEHCLLRSPLLCSVSSSDPPPPRLQTSSALYPLLLDDARSPSKPVPHTHHSSGFLRDQGLETELSAWFQSSTQRRAGPWSPGSQVLEPAQPRPGALRSI